VVSPFTFSPSHQSFHQWVDATASCLEMGVIPIV
jgi:hypothetical protein